MGSNEVMQNEKSMNSVTRYGKIFKVLDNFLGFIYYLGKSWTDFGKF